MDTEQLGPPTDEARIVRDIEWVRISQLRFLEGYRARMTEPHPMRTNARGEALNQRESKWSFGKEVAEHRVSGHLPSHDRERWIAGFMHADGIAAERGTAAMERADPSKPPPRPKPVSLAEPIEAFPEAILHRQQLREYKAAEERSRQRDLYERRLP